MSSLTDEYIWSLDTLIKEPTDTDVVDGDGDVVRASLFAQDGTTFGENLMFGIENDLVFGTKDTATPIVTTVDDQDELQTLEDQERDDVVAVLDHPSVPVTSAGWAELGVEHMYTMKRSMEASMASYCSDGTDRSCSFASEESSTPTPRVTGRRLSEGDQTTYDQRIEATLAVNMTKSLNIQSYEREVQLAEKVFTMGDIAHFDRQFGREVYLEQLGKGFVDGSSGKSLASYRMSSFQRRSSTTDIIKQGWLMKRGEVVRSWHKRWFILRRMMEGPVLTYARDDSATSPTKMIELSSTSRCIVATKASKQHEFRLMTSADSSRKEFPLAATSNFEMTAWVTAIQAAINAGNKSAFEGAQDFQRIWNETGIQGFLIRYGIRKCSSRNRLQTRVLELNFADQTITNSRRGETLTTMSFNELQSVSVSSTRSSGEEHGIILDFSGRHRAWPIFLDTVEARDDLFAILQKIVNNEVTGEDLESRCSRLTLKTGVMERKNAGANGTIKGRLFFCLHENSLVIYPEDGDINERPWYVIALKALHVTCKEEKSILNVGRLVLQCGSPSECRAWYNAITSAMLLPQEIIEIELKERVKIRAAFHSTVSRLRKLMKANVTPEVNGPPKDHKTVELMISTLWGFIFTDEPYTSNTDHRWLEIGFQRGGPASDLRSSGLLGLYCLIYFVKCPSREFQRILKRTRHGVSTGNMKNYPLAIACINVASILVEMFGFGDAGSHSEGCSPNAMRTFVLLISQTVGNLQSSTTRGSISLRPVGSYESWDDIVGEIDNHVFENIFCLLFPILDTLFVEMGAGYMEFGQVVHAFRRRINVIFDALPKSMKELEKLASEPCTDTLTLLSPRSLMAQK